MLKQMNWMIKEKKHTFSLSDNGLSETTSSIEVFESWLYIRATVALLTVLCFPALIAITCSESKWSWSSFGVSNRIKTKSNLDSRALPILKRHERKTMTGIKQPRKPLTHLFTTQIPCRTLKRFEIKEIANSFWIQHIHSLNGPYAIQHVHSFICTFGRMRTWPFSTIKTAEFSVFCITTYDLGLLNFKARVLHDTSAVT